MGGYEYGWFGELASARAMEPAQDSSLAFSQVFRSHAPYILGLVRRLGVRACDVEDVAQEVFLAVHAGLPNFQGRSKLKTWLCSICFHKVEDYRRQIARRREIITADEPTGVIDETPQDGIARKQRVLVLEAILARLPDAQRQVFVLYELEELPMCDVARILGCPLFTAYGRLRTARHEVRTLFERALKRGSL
jgi:RNA polymerase sigma-70 factor (ECF subfamily)